MLKHNLHGSGAEAFGRVVGGGLQAGFRACQTAFHDSSAGPHRVGAVLVLGRNRERSSEHTIIVSRAPLFYHRPVDIASKKPQWLIVISL
jgi:hypothetical protein